jgi:hypothetical protein
MATLVSKFSQAFGLYFLKEVTESFLVVIAAIATVDLPVGALQLGAKRGELASLFLAELSSDYELFHRCIDELASALETPGLNLFVHDLLNISIQVDLHNQFSRLIVAKWEG